MTEHLDGCPGLEDIAALAEGRLAGAERERVVGHLAGCEECREVFAATVGVMEEVGGAREGVGATEEATSRDVAEVRPRAGVGDRRRWTAGLATAAGLAVVGAIVVNQISAPRTPPTRSEWLAQMPPAKELLPELWGGVVMRGGGDVGADLTRQSAELGALLVDLEVALAAEDAERAAELARRMATIMEEAGLLEEEVVALRGGAGTEGDAMRALRATLPRLEPSLRERFLPFYLDLGAFAEEARLAAITDNREFVVARSTRRYCTWLLSQTREPLSFPVRDGLEVLRIESASSADWEKAATAVLRGVADTS